MTQYLSSVAFKNLKISKPLLIAIIGAILLGASPIFVRLTDIGAISTAFYRVFLALPLLWIWGKWEGSQQLEEAKQLTRKDHILFFAAGFLFALDLMTWHWSLDLTTIVNSALLNNFAPFFVPFFIWLFCGKRPSVIFILAATAAIVGSAILTGESLQLSVTHVWGDLLALFSAAAYSGYILVLKKLRERFATSLLMLGTTFFTMVILFVGALLTPENFIPTTRNDWMGILGLALLVHVGGQGFVAYAMGHLSAAFIVLILLITPMVSALLGWVVFQEALGMVQLLGGALILVSIIIARQDEGKPDPIAVDNEEESYATRA